jgi:ribosomal protein S18 acetylase RimI-like enzyme
LTRSKKIKIILALESHISEIAELHLNTLMDGIYAKLGYSFLVKYYRRSIQNKNKIFIALVENNIVGFLELKKSGNEKFSLGLSVLGKLLLLFFQDPRYIYLMYRRLLSSKLEEKGALEISNFSVKKAFRSKGFGRALLKKAIDEALEKKLNIFTYTHNKKLARFYVKKYNASIEIKDNLIVYKSYYCKFNLNK